MLRRRNARGILNAEGIIGLVVRAGEARARDLISVPTTSCYSYLVFK